MPIYSGNMLQLTIRNCKRIIVRANTFASIYNVAHLELENIEDLVLHSNALSFPIADWGHVNIWMRNVRVDYIPAHTFNGFIQGITIQQSTIGTIERFAANGIRSGVQRLHIADTFIGQSEPYAFKKFTVDSVQLNNVTMGGPIASKFFYGVDVTGAFAITNCNFSTVQPSAFDMTGNKDTSFNELLRYPSPSILYFRRGLVQFDEQPHPPPERRGVPHVPAEWGDHPREPDNPMPSVRIPIPDNR